MSATVDEPRPAGVHGIRMQVLWSRLQGLVDEQAGALMRTAFSPIVRECEDISAGIFDTDGNMLAQAVTGTPGHINSLAIGAAHMLDEYPVDELSPGDILITYAVCAPLLFAMRGLEARTLVLIGICLKCVDVAFAQWPALYDATLQRWLFAWWVDHGPAPSTIALTALRDHRGVINS